MINIYASFRNFLITCITGIGIMTISGCDFTARGDLKRAEKLLDEAVLLQADVSGDHKAKRAYFKAQSALEEGMYLNRRRDINLARDKAAEAKKWAEEAIAFAEIYNEEIRKEQESLGLYKD